MKILILITLILAILVFTGCATTPESRAASDARRDAIVAASVKAGKDSRCLEGFGMKFCYTKEREE